MCNEQPSLMEASGVAINNLSLLSAVKLIRDTLGPVLAVHYRKEVLPIMKHSVAVIGITAQISPIEGL